MLGREMSFNLTEHDPRMQLERHLTAQSWTPRVKAPSTTRLVPLMKLAAGLTRNTAALDNFWGVFFFRATRLPEEIRERHDPKEHYKVLPLMLLHQMAWRHLDHLLDDLRGAEGFHRAWDFIGDKLAFSTLARISYGH